MNHVLPAMGNIIIIALHVTVLVFLKLNFMIKDVLNLKKFLLIIIVNIVLENSCIINVILVAKHA